MSPDGRHLAFASRRDGNWELYILDFMSGELRRLTDNPAFDAGHARIALWLWFLYLLAVLGLMLAACGSSSDGALSAPAARSNSRSRIASI